MKKSHEHSGNTAWTAAKKLFLVAVLVLLLVLSVPTSPPAYANADFGPKPSVNVTLSGIGNQKYFATLLSKTDSTGPLSASNLNYYEDKYDDKPDWADAFYVFRHYEDRDGFYFLGFMEECTGIHSFSWGYYPPYEFKILLYFPETQDLIATKSYEQYAFASYFHVEFKKLNLLVDEQSSCTLYVKQSYNYGKEILSLLFRIILTLAIEIGIAFLFRLTKKKQLQFIIIANLITQIGLNVALNVINYYSGYFAFIFYYVLLELAIVVVETIIYCVFFGKHPEWNVKKSRLFLYALIANAASFALGMVLALIWPKIF